MRSLQYESIRFVVLIFHLENDPEDYNRGMKLYRELSNLLILNGCSLQEDLEEYLVINSVIRTSNNVLS